MNIATMKFWRETLALSLLVSCISVSEVVWAGAPTCTTYSSGAYCQYTGKVSRVYVNSSDQILMYFDTPLDLAQPTSVGISGVSSTVATIVNISVNPAFADYFYAAILSAQARDATIAVQMRTVSAGYLVTDRIWVY